MSACAGGSHASREGTTSFRLRRRMAAAKKPKNPDEAALRELGLSWPETTEDFPWGHRTLKVKGKDQQVRLDHKGLPVQTVL